MSTNVSYNSINKIRMKLLLFIDKEVQSSKINYLKGAPKTYPELLQLVKFEETFSQNKPDETQLSFIQKPENIMKCYKPSRNYIENYQKKAIISKIKNIKNSKSEIFHSNFNPKKNTKKTNARLKPINEYKNKYYDLNATNIINLKGKVYSIKSTKKKRSSVIEISNKQENGEEYLIKLCESLKIMKQEQMRKKSNVCFFSNLSRPKEKITNLTSSHLFNKQGNNKKENVSTTKHIDTINRNNTKINKKKSFHKKSIIKANSNANNKSNVTKK